MNEIENILLKEIDNRTPAVQYVIFDNEKIIFKKQLGFSNIKNNVKADKRTTFNAFSITKTFTALAIMQLVEKGKINLDNYVKIICQTFHIYLILR